MQIYKLEDPNQQMELKASQAALRLQERVWILYFLIQKHAMNTTHVSL